MHKHNLKPRYTNYLIGTMAIAMVVIACRFIFIGETPLINHMILGAKNIQASVKVT